MRGQVPNVASEQLHSLQMLLETLSLPVSSMAVQLSLEHVCSCMEHATSQVLGKLLVS